MTNEEQIEELKIIIKDSQNKLESLEKKVEDDKLNAWKPKGNWFLNPYFDVDEVYGNWESDDYNKFDTKEEAKKIANKINAWLKLYHIAKYLNDGWKPNWNNDNECKYSIYYDYDCNEYDISRYIKVEDLNSIYFKSGNLAIKAMELMGEDIKYLFDLNTEKPERWKIIRRGNEIDY